MRKIGNWIVIEQHDTVVMTIIMTTLTQQEKHFMEDRYRSFLCTGVNCSYCLRKVEKRIRYQVEVLIEGEQLRWEFSEEVFNTINKLKPANGTINVVVSRFGAGRKSRYQVKEEVAPCQTNVKYQTGKYGHMVNR